MTLRTDKLRNELLDTRPRICPERARYFTASMKTTEGQPIVKRRVRAYDDVLRSMSLYVRDGELLVGNLASTPRSRCCPACSAG